MGNIVNKNFDNPDETRQPSANIKMDVVDLGSVKAARAVVQPGWKWSEHIKPVVGTEKCESTHVGVCISGSMMAVDENGNEVKISAGDAYYIGPSHDGWVVGDEPVVIYEFDSNTAQSYGIKQ
jgi:hypothetical protein